MMASRWRALLSTRLRFRSCCAPSSPETPCRQQARVAEDRVQGRAELVRHVGQELRLGGGGLLQLDALAPQRARSGRPAPRWPAARALSSRARGLLELLVECARSISSVRSWRTVTMAVTSPCSEKILPEIASTGSASPVSGSTRPISPRRRSPSEAEQEVRDERGEVRVVGLRRARRARARCSRARRTGAPRGRSSSPARPRGRSPMMGSATESMMRSRRSRSARTSASAMRKLAVVLLDLLAGAAQVADVAQDGHETPCPRACPARPCSAARTGGRIPRRDRRAAARGGRPPGWRSGPARTRRACC